MKTFEAFFKDGAGKVTRAEIYAKDHREARQEARRSNNGALFAGPSEIVAIKANR